MPRPNRPQWHAHSGRWRCRVKGKLEYFPKSIGKLDRPQIGGIPEAAWKYLNALKAVPDPSGENGLTVRGLVEAYLEWAEEEAGADRLSVGQYQGHRTHLTLLVTHPLDNGRLLGELSARDLSPGDLDGFFEALRLEGGRLPSAHYRHNIGKSVRCALNWAARPIKGRNPSRLIPGNHLAGYRFPRPPKATRGYVEGATIRRFLRWAWARARARVGLSRRFDRLFLLMLRFERLTGCRPGEATALRWDHVHWGEGWVILEEHKTAHSTGEPRLIALTPPVARLLRAIERLDGRHAERVFTHRRSTGAIDRGQLDALAGEPWPSGSAASAKVAKLREAAIEAGVEGIEATGPKKLVAYANRHGLATEAILDGASPIQVSRLLGNSAEIVLSRYVHADRAKLAEVAREMVEKRRKGRS